MKLMLPSIKAGAEFKHRTTKLLQTTAPMLLSSCLLLFYISSGSCK